MADTWLDAADVGTALGASLSEVTDDSALQFWCDAVRDYVEERRADLVVTTYAEDGVTVLSSAFEPSPRIVGGAALLAYRLYQRRTAALGVVAAAQTVGSILRDDPDVSRMLGIGRHRRWRFGAPRLTEDVTA